MSFWKKDAPPDSQDGTPDYREIEYYPDPSEWIEAGSMRPRFPLRKFMGWAVFVLLALFLASGLFLAWKFYAVGKKVTIRNEETSALEVLSSFVSSEKKTLSGEENGRINILLLGAAGKDKPGKNLTDTVMVVSIDTRNNRMALLSLPRDLYVKIPETRSAAKINSLYQYGLLNDLGTEPIEKTVTQVTGLPIHYHAVVEFDGFTKIIDDLGGINVMNERDIYDPRYPGPGYSYETFELPKGLQHLDGATALKYVRERHADPDGDFGRAKRQQQVIQAVKNKVFSAGTYFNVIKLSSLLDTLGDSVRTDIPLEELESFIALSRRVDTQNIVNKVVDAWEKDSLLKVSHVFFGPTRAFILVPRAGSYSEIQELAANLFDLEAIRRRQEEIGKEGAKIAILNQSGESSLLPKIRKLLKDQLGLEVVSANNSSLRRPVEKTLVYDLQQKNQLFTLDELLKKLPGALAAEKSAIMSKADLSAVALAKADILVILGRDLLEPYGFDEDSVEDFKNASDSQEYLVN